MDWELAILIIGMTVELVIVFLMIKRGVFRSFPIFAFYICWSLFNDPFVYHAQIEYSSKKFFHLYMIDLSIDSVMIFAVLVEIAWSVLRPIRKSLPKYSWVGVAVLVAIGALILWPVAGLAAPRPLSHFGKTLFFLQETPAILRAVFFLALAGFSQVLSIGWRDRELQIASGLGFYSIVSLAVTMAHTHQLSGTQYYHWLDRAVGVSYVAALVYWVFAFARQSVERREFTPQMQSVLLAVAGAARSTRIGLSNSNSEQPRP